jgi:hypothetical protein
MKRQDPRYNIADSIEVCVKEHKYFVFLPHEIVVKEVRGRNGKTHYRRETRWDIETCAILRASGIYHGTEN